MKRFFSTEGKFNIFNLIGILFALISLFTNEIMYVLIAIYISITIRIPMYIREYKGTKKLRTYFIIDLVAFCIITLIFIIEVFNNVYLILI